VESFLTGETELQELASVTLPTPSAAVDRAFISGDGHWLFLLEGGKQVEVMDLRGASADGMRIITLDYSDYPIEALVLASGGEGEEQGTAINLYQPPIGEKVDLAAVARGSKTLQSIFKSSQDANAEAAERAKTDPDLAEALRHRKMMVSRIGIGVNPTQAGISLADRDGNDRIVMRVTDTGEPEILMLDADGKEVARIPERKEKP
jgi:hypothetical protein